MHIDQEAIRFDYDDPKNARWVKGDDEEDFTVLFYPELLIPKDLQHPLSPFVATCWNFTDLQQYQNEEATRRHIKDKVWPVLQRIYIHFENRNFSLLKKDGALVASKAPDFDDDEARAGWLMSVTRHFFDFFIVKPEDAEELGKIAAHAYVRYELAFSNLADQYFTSGRTSALWKELKSVRRQFMELYESLQPLLMMRRYWRADEQDLSKYELSVKNFEDLKGFYIDCVETSFRLLVMGLALFLIGQTGYPAMKTRKGEKDIWWFEQLSNGAKLEQLDKHPVFSNVTQALDLKLRNGLGHHSAHYDVGLDEIVYVKSEDVSLQEVRLSYTDFVDKVFEAYCAFEAATVFFHFLFLGGRGAL